MIAKLVIVVIQMEQNKAIILVVFILLSETLIGQSPIKYVLGKVTFVTSKNIYVKFDNTQQIDIGDTLYTKRDTIYKPFLIVKEKSSVSCVNHKLDTTLIQKNDEVYYAIYPDTSIQINQNNDIAFEDTLEETSDVQTLDKSDNRLQDTTALKSYSQNITGRFTFSNNASIQSDNNFQRIRASLSLNAQHISDSRISFQSYATYRHRYGIDQINTTFYDDMKIFTLALQYDVDSSMYASVGRKINPNIANLGAVDGAHLHKDLNKRMAAGVFAGFRPNITNYSFDTDWPLYGLYIHVKNNDALSQGQSTIAFAEQKYLGATDRRFLYFQHSNYIVKNVSFFFSSEFDIYQRIHDEITHQVKLTSLYTSLRYRIRRNLTLSAAFDNRRNIIFYEAQQNFIDQLLAQETRRGLRFQINYNPIRRININSSIFLRYQGDNPKPTQNTVMTLGISSPYGAGSYLSFTYNSLESFYFGGQIYSLRTNKAILKNKVNIELNYRHLKYDFFNSEQTLDQNIFGVSCQFNVAKSRHLSINYEGTYDKNKSFHRYFITFVQRIKK